MHHDECEGPSFSEIRGVDPASFRVFHAFFRAMRLHRQLMFKMMSDKNIYPGQAGCLWVIGNHDGIPQRDLARRPDEKDQRMTRIYLTDAGRYVQDEMKSTLASFINASFGKMPDDDLGGLERLLGSLCSIIDRELSSPEPIAD